MLLICVVSVLLTSFFSFALKTVHASIVHELHFQLKSDWNNETTRDNLFLSISVCASLSLPNPHLSLTPAVSTVTHQVETNMPIVRFTSRVCKFHTCPIILSPSIPPSLPPPSFLVPSLFSHMLTTLAHPHLTLSSLRSRKQRWLVKNMQQKPAESHRV